MSSSPPDPESDLFTFVIEMAEAQPLTRRIRLYTSLAQRSVCPKRREILISMATSLSDADARCREFAFELARKEEGI